MHSVNDGVFSLELEFASFSALHCGKMSGQLSVQLQLSNSLKKVERKHLLFTFMFHYPDGNSAAELFGQQRYANTGKCMKEQNQQRRIGGVHTEQKPH